MCYLSSLPPLLAGVQLWPRLACGLSFNRSQPDSRVFRRVLRFSSLIKIDSHMTYMCSPAKHRGSFAIIQGQSCQYLNPCSASLRPQFLWCVRNICKEELTRKRTMAKRPVKSRCRWCLGNSANPMISEKWSFGEVLKEVTPRSFLVQTQHRLV